MARPPDITSRSQLVAALGDAARIEHSVICQYLYAAHSLKAHSSETGVTAAQLERVRQWQSNILEVARGEMEHLGLVGNLLSSVGGAPTFHRWRFPHAGAGLPPGTRYELLPFSSATLERFMLLEASHEPGYRWPGHEECECIGDLYARIRRGFEALDAAEPPLFIGPRGAQVSNRTLGLPERWYEMRLRPVDDLEGALTVLDQILEEGHHEGEHAHPTHYERFEETLRDYTALGSLPGFQPVRPVVSNPTTGDGDPGSGRVVVEHPVTRRAMRLFDLAYETMLLMLDRYYGYGGQDERERTTLQQIALFPLMTVVVRPLGEVLTRMPVRDAPDSPTAGPAFDFDPGLRLPAGAEAAAVTLYERLAEMVEECGALRREIDRERAAWAAAVAPRLAFLHETLEAIGIKLRHDLQIEARWFRAVYDRLRGD